MNTIFTIEDLRKRTQQLIKVLPDENWRLYEHLDDKGTFEYIVSHSDISQTGIMIRLQQGFSELPEPTTEQEAFGAMFLKARVEFKLLLKQIELRDERIKSLEQRVMRARIRDVDLNHD